MTREIRDDKLTSVTGGALDLSQRRAAFDERRRAKNGTGGEGGQVPGGPGVEHDDAADQAPSSGPVDLARR